VFVVAVQISFPLTVNLINCPGTPLPCDLSVALGVKQKK
jgi:hypothetical protein